MLLRHPHPLHRSPLGAAVDRALATEPLLAAFGALPALLEGALDAAPQGWGARAPRLHVREGTEGLAVTAEVPGVREEDLEVTIERGALRLSFSRRDERPEGARTLQRERGPLNAKHALALPQHLDPARATAHLEDGVLTVKVPRREATGPVRVPVTVG
jgi:HSP20 family protein